MSDKDKKDNNSKVIPIKPPQKAKAPTRSLNELEQRYYDMATYGMLVIANYLDLLRNEMGVDLAEMDEDYAYFSEHFDVLVRASSGEDLNEMLKAIADAKAALH